MCKIKFIILEKLDQISPLHSGWHQGSGVDYCARFFQLAKEERPLFTSPQREKCLVNMHCWALKPLSSPSWPIYLLTAQWGAKTKWVLSLWLPNNHFILTVDIFPDFFQVYSEMKFTILSVFSRNESFPPSHFQILQRSINLSGPLPI